VADFGDGWLPLEDTPIDSFQVGGLKIKKMAKEKGRDPDDITFAPAFPVRSEESVKEWIEKINQYIKAGAQHILIDFSETLIPPKKALKFLKLFNDEIIPNLIR
jgi:alkanesulfonate monooxygenase SsuD/methylene tetrahydromethanopterin reductase-like flavin-dependent oxidoreductase (luciferase family)